MSQQRDRDAELLTDEERAALGVTADLANRVRQIIGAGDDWNEAAQRIHAIQHTIMAQAAARAYPDLYRLLGAPAQKENR